MNPKAKNFHEFFGQDTYVIPDYQRPYEWQDSSHINDFWGIHILVFSSNSTNSLAAIHVVELASNSIRRISAS